VHGVVEPVEPPKPAIAEPPLIRPKPRTVLGVPAFDRPALPFAPGSLAGLTFTLRH
jgi:hypothetical protein